MFSLLKNAGYKFKKHYPISGKPDIVFIEQKVVVFIDGEFWHGKNFAILKNKIPKFWVKKIGDNISRDKRTEKKLRSGGWHILRLWDKKIIRNPQNVLQRIIKFVNKVNNTD